MRGDIEASRLVINENATFLGSAKVGTGEALPRQNPGIEAARDQFHRLVRRSDRRAYGGNAVS